MTNGSHPKETKPKGTTPSPTRKPADSKKEQSDSKK